MTYNEAKTLLNEYLSSESLKTHCLCVAASMKEYAKLFSEDEKVWEITGLLHDLDYEKYPDIHPDKCLEILSQKGENSAMIHAIAAHKYTDRIESKLDKALFACDELSGFVYACVLVRPGKTIDGLEVSSVKKKFKDKGFAKAVSREDMAKGAELLGIILEDHMQHVIDALKANREILGI